MDPQDHAKLLPWAVGQSTVACFYSKGPDKQTSDRVYHSNKSQWGRVEQRQSVRLRTKRSRAPAANVRRDEAITSPDEASRRVRPGSLMGTCLKARSHFPTRGPAGQSDVQDRDPTRDLKAARPNCKSRSAPYLTPQLTGHQTGS
ncbi:hypothetical protein Bbelb_054270 [Branchiostoma belcheri]|nr:hypothetical protein Bbelb_054270 [Branchiostoma belcheri]